MYGQPYIQKIIISTKKFRKGQQELDKACIEAKLLMKKLQMLMKTRFVRRFSFSMKLQGMLINLIFIITNNPCIGKQGCLMS
jgi:hypothetical protein